MSRWTLKDTITVAVCLPLGIGCLTALFVDMNRHFAQPTDTLTYAICDASETRCEVREQVLVGVGCGPEKYTMVAREESDFPFSCETISAHGVRPLVNGN